MFDFPAPVPESERLTLSDILETNVDAKYYVKDRIRESRLERIKDRLSHPLGHFRKRLGGIDINDKGTILLTDFLLSETMPYKISFPISPG